ncbi:MAG: hypothetical protein ACNA7U_06960 [Candidatus Izemoplasmataceae bacterium]|uniref:hypothetical protein n=1 Tax=Liberiplasma polymorphum TaxID=3374570 RepID=UPI00377641E2
MSDLRGNASFNRPGYPKKQRFEEKGLKNQHTHGWEFVTEQEGIREVSGAQYVIANLLTVFISATIFIIFMLLLF